MALAFSTREENILGCPVPDGGSTGGIAGLIGSWAGGIAGLIGPPIKSSRKEGSDAA